MKDHLSQTFSALADPTRRAILDRLTLGEANVSDISRPFMKEMSLPAITKHLKVLENAGLIHKTREAQWRKCAISPEPMKEALGWMDPYRAFWEESFDRLGEHLKEVQAQNQDKDKDRGKKNVSEAK
jgi:DNA-binding transcriptional ArsR family regulator